MLTPAKRIFPAFLASCCASIRSSVTSSGRCFGVQVPDVHVIRAELLQAGVEVAQRIRLVAPRGVLVESAMSLRLRFSAAPTIRSLLPPM